MTRSLILMSTLTCMGMAASAAAADDDTLGEVVVTAQRRSERLQDVPAAITALNGDSLNELHLQGNADLAQRVPSLSFDVLGPGESTLSIRGLGTAYGLAPAVSYYLNETPLDIRTDGYAGAPDIDFFDVERIEVLRGPQGTLYGSSAMGGALRILTVQPNPAAVAVNAEIGGSYMERGGAGYSAKSAVNLPLSTDAAVRLVGTYEHVPGYINRVLPGDYSAAEPVTPLAARRTNDADIKSARVIASWKPFDGLTITPSFAISRIEASDKLTTYSNLPDFTIAGYIPSPTTSRLTVGNLAVTYDAGFASILSSTSVLSRAVDALNDFTLFWANLAPAFGLTYPPNTPGTDLTTSRNSGFVQEIRLTSPAEQRLRWVAGVYFSHFRQHSTETTGSADFAAAIGQTDSPILYHFDQAVIDQQAAVFADLTYKILPQVEITAGERYYELRDSLENEQDGAIAPPSQPLVHAKASGSSPRVVLTYHPVADATVYATAARGYRPGGPNVGLPEGVGCTLNSAYRPLYDPDSVWNYELGAKSEFLQRRLSVDVAVYRIDWKNVQQAITDPGCGSLFVANAGSARSKGVEAEINARPLDALRVWLSGSYTDAKYQSIAAAFQGSSAVLAGDAVPDVPKRKVNVGGEYTRSFGNYQSYLRLDWSHLGAVPTGFTYKDVRPAYSTLDGAIGVRGERYEVSLYGHNLTNTDGILSIGVGATDSYGAVFNSRIFIPPRTVGIDLKMHL
ncbi:MAG: TonB-dependent receptor [Proteobacteria bacterium]|nr:TonB-dependent receptor [Pseudomonadota bacterium]